MSKLLPILAVVGAGALTAAGISYFNMNSDAAIDPKTDVKSYIPADSALFISANLS